MKKIILLGYMGCGKSTIAQKLSGIVSIPYVDLDEYIEKKEKMSIKQNNELRPPKAINLS